MVQDAEVRVKLLAERAEAKQRFANPETEITIGRG